MKRCFYPRRSFAGLAAPALLLAALCVGPIAAAAQGNVALTSSNLPIILINTEGRIIVDEPKVTARMAIIDNGPGARNTPQDAPNGYNGYIGIELRGASSQALYDKKSYAIETRGVGGSDSTVSLLGFPKEEDWVLYAPYGDKSLIRNVLTYRLSETMGHYASRTRYCEVVLNGTYLGVYVFMEKIKRDKGRVNISKLDPEDASGDALTGGYIIKIDKREGADTEGWFSAHPAPGTPHRIYYQYHAPKGEDITPVQEAYIQGYIKRFEDMMASDAFGDPATGYPSYIDTRSFVDYFILNELSRNVDGYRLSTFLYKDRDSKGGKLVAGPVWDYNIAYGNANYYNASNIKGFQYEFAEPGDSFQPPFWWRRLMTDPAFRAAVGDRWKELRQGPLRTDSLGAFIDRQAALLSEAQTRNFQQWQILGRWVWPNVFVGNTYAEEVSYLKDWLRQRAGWLDANMPKGSSTAVENLPADAAPLLSEPYPNPFADRAQIALQSATRREVRVALYDALGRQVRVLYAGALLPGERREITVEAADLPAGVYFCRAQGEGFLETKVLVALGR